MTRPSDYHLIPEAVLLSLENYAEQGVPPGSFTEAAIANDFVECVAKADPNTMAALPAIAGYIYNKMPSICYGSRKVIQAWIEFHAAQRKGVEGDELQALADKVTEAKYESDRFRGRL